MRIHACMILALVVVFGAPLPAQQTEFIGSYHKTPEQKAMECYARGVRAKRKAESEKDPQKQAKLYLKAKEELSKAVVYQGYYDAYLALGQVYLALGQNQSAYEACTQTQTLKPGDETAKACVEEAQKRMRTAMAGGAECSPKKGERSASRPRLDRSVMTQGAPDSRDLPCF